MILGAVLSGANTGADIYVGGPTQNVVTWELPTMNAKASWCQVVEVEVMEEYANGVL